MENDQPIYTIDVIRDISERKKTEEALKKSEKLYRAIGESIDFGVWVCDPDGRNIYASESFLKLIGKTQAQISNFGWCGALHPDDVENTIGAWNECVRTGAKWNIEHRFRGVDGKWNHILARGVPIRDDEGSIACWAGINLDISDLKHTEEELKSVNIKLFEADRQKDEFLAMLSHELRNPLAPISAVVEIMKKNASINSAEHKNINLIDSQIKRVVHLLDDLLDVSRITHGKISIQKEYLDLRTIIERSVEIASLTLCNCTLKIKYENPSTPVWVNADFHRMEQIVDNLVNNAVKFCDEGEIIVSLDYEHEDKRSAGRAIIRVSDTGMGITPELLPHIFELFVQDDKSLDRKRGGLGIGLTMVKQLVELHGGKVSAQSRGRGKGSTFTVELPASSAPEAALKKKEEPASDDNFLVDGNRPLRILVVDDYKDFADTFAEMLDLWNIITDVTYDGLTAIKKALENPPDVIMLDIGMPGMSGYETAEQIRKEPSLKDVKIIALTGYGQDETIQRSQKSGFDYLLVKAVDTAKLKILLKKICFGLSKL
jgi:PAS domain S-box-containing protein